MDLFTLVARLTLDEKDYEKALKQAERKSKNANLDSSGNIRANDQYSATLQRAEQQARNADLTAQGRVGVDTSGLTSDIREAERTVSNADLDANGEADLATDGLTEDVSTAEGITSGAELDADGEAAMDTSGLESDVDEAEGIASGADLDADGEAALDNSGLGDDVSEAEAIVDGGDYNGEGEITLDLSGLDASVQEAQQSIGEVSSSIEGASNQSSEFGNTFAGVIDSLESKLRAAGIIAAVGGITTAFRNAIHTSANYADEVDKTSQALRMSAHDYQVWEYVLNQSGASMSLVTRAWDNMDDAASGIDWTGITDAMGNAFDPSNYDNPADLFTGMMEALAGLEDEGRRADILEAVFGPRGRQFNAFLNGGIEGLEQLKQEAEDLGLIMSDEDIAEGVAFGDSLTAMERALNGLRDKVAGELFPWLTQCVNLITEMLSGEDAQALVTQIGGALSRLGEAVLSLFFEQDDEGEWHLSELAQSTLDVIVVALQGIAALVETISGILSNQYENSYRDWYRSVYGHNPGTPAQEFAEAIDPNSPANQAWANAGDDQRRDALRRGFGFIFGTGGTTTQTEPEAQTVDRSGYNAVWRAYQLPEDRQFTRHGSRVTTSTGEIYIPEGDTEAGWRAFANIMESYLGRPVTNNELQQLIDSGIHLDDAFEASVANMNLDAATVTIDGATINYTINGRVVAQSNLDSFSPYGDMLNGSDGSQAKGLWSVPYDDYLANLHRDEMVLTASQAREYRDGDGENAEIVGAIQELRNDMANLRIFVGERAFGKTVVDYSGRRMRGYMGRAEDRQFAGYGWG